MLADVYAPVYRAEREKRVISGSGAIQPLNMADHMWKCKAESTEPVF